MLFSNKIKKFVGSKKILSKIEFKKRIIQGFRYEVSKNKLKHADSILILIFGTIIASPILVTFTYHYEVLPYRFVPLIIFFAIGVGLFFSKRSVNLE